jgi:hypothetical protein
MYEAGKIGALTPDQSNFIANQRKQIFTFKVGDESYSERMVVS